MFGKFLSKVVKNEETAEKINDAAERAAGKDLDGDGDIGVAGHDNAPEPEPEAAPEKQEEEEGGLLGGMDMDGLMKMGSGMLQSNKRGKVGATREGGLQGLAASFQGFSPQVQEEAEAGARDLDDGHDIPLSTLDGKKKSLFVGINYPGTNGELRGCITDVHNVKELITTKFNFPTDKDSMRILIDDGNGDGMPTFANIVAGMKWLIAGAESGDSLFFHYSGHGAYAKDVKPDTDEADEQDETLVPCDYKTAGMIIDDDIFDMMIAPLPKGVRLTVITDCCHSGSVLDLPYSYVLDGQHDRPVEIDHRKIAMAAAMAAGKALMAKDYGGAFKNVIAAGKSYMAMQKQNEAAPEKPPMGEEAPAAAPSADGSLGSVTDSQNVSEDYISIKTAMADVIQFSGCKDSQTSADAFIEGEHAGAMSYSLIKAFEDFGTDQTYAEVLKNVRTTLMNKYTQIPQMSAGHRMLDLDAKFHM